MACLCICGGLVRARGELPLELPHHIPMLRCGLHAQTLHCHSAHMPPNLPGAVTGRQRAAPIRTFVADSLARGRAPQQAAEPETLQTR